MARLSSMTYFRPSWVLVQSTSLPCPSLLDSGASHGGRLGEAITVAHPAEARRAGVVAFLEGHGPAVLAARGAGSPVSFVALSA